MANKASGMFLLAVSVVADRGAVEPVPPAGDQEDDIPKYLPFFAFLFLGGILLSNRETIKLIRAYYRVTDPQLRKRVLDLLEAIGKPS